MVLKKNINYNKFLILQKKLFYFLLFYVKHKNYKNMDKYLKKAEELELIEFIKNEIYGDVWITDKFPFVVSSDFIEKHLEFNWCMKYLIEYNKTYCNLSSDVIEKILNNIKQKKKGYHYDILINFVKKYLALNKNINFNIIKCFIRENNIDNKCGYTPNTYYSLLNELAEHKHIGAEKVYPMISKRFVKDKIIFDKFCRKSYITIDFIKKNIDKKWNWFSLMENVSFSVDDIIENPDLPWVFVNEIYISSIINRGSEIYKDYDMLSRFIKTFKNIYNIQYYIFRNEYLPYGFIKYMIDCDSEFFNYVEFKYLHLYNYNDLDENFIEKYIDKDWNWENLINRCSNNFINKHINKFKNFTDKIIDKYDFCDRSSFHKIIENNLELNWNWSLILKVVELDFIDKYLGVKFNWSNEISKNNNVNIEFINKHIDKYWDFSLVNFNRNSYSRNKLKYTKKFIESNENVLLTKNCNFSKYLLSSLSPDDIDWGERLILKYPELEWDYSQIRRKSLETFPPKFIKEHRKLIQGESLFGPLLRDEIYYYILMKSKINLRAENLMKTEACNKIGNWFLNIKYDPSYKYCRDRLNKEYNELYNN